LEITARERKPVKAGVADEKQIPPASAALGVGMTRLWVAWQESQMRVFERARPRKACAPYALRTLPSKLLSFRR
jgi:hypothetical protein